MMIPASPAPHHFHVDKKAIVLLDLAAVMLPKLLNILGRHAGVLSLALGVVATAQAQILYTQPSLNDGNSYGSQNDINPGGFGAFATAYDNFTLAGGGSVGSATWVGSYYSGAPSVISQFTISFWADNAGQPGSLLQSATVPGTANETALGIFGGFPTFSYSAVLSSPFSAAAGTQYWMSVVPDIGFPPQWGWATASGGDGVAFQNFLGTPSSQLADRAFTLVAVPEPSPLAAAALLIVGAAGCAVRRRMAK